MSFFKGRAILWLLIPAVFVIAFLWDSQTEQKPQFVQQDTSPDFFLTNTQSIGFSQDGQVSQTFNSDMTLHYKSKMQTHMTNPTFSVQQQAGVADNNLSSQSWSVNAQSAINNELSEKLQLSGNVSVTLHRGGALNPIYLSMPELSINLASQNAFTQSPVVLNHELYIMTADGMDADFIKQRIDFLSNITFKEL